MDLQSAIVMTTYGFIAALAAIVAYRLLTGGINVTNLLGRKGASTAPVSPERVQLLISTLVAGAMYLSEAIDLRGLHRMPDVSTSTLALVGASHGTYLLSKAMALYSRSARP